MKTRTPWTCSGVKPATSSSVTRPSTSNRRGSGSPFPQRPSGLVSASRAWPSLAGEGLGEDDGEPSGDEEGEVAVRGEHGRDLGQGRGGVVDDLEDAVAADEVDALALLGRQAVGVALASGDAVGHAEVGGAAFEGGEGVGTGVDDHDVVTELGERDGQASRPATEVEDPQGATEVGLTLLDQLAHGVPDALVADVGPWRRRGRGGTGDGRLGTVASLVGHVVGPLRRPFGVLVNGKAAALVGLTLVP